MIEIKNIKKIYNTKTTQKIILKDISLRIDPGQIQALVGPNGAGKTTLIKILCGIQSPSSGSVNVAGFNPVERKKEFYKTISVVFGHKNSLWWDLPLIDSFKSAKAVYKIDNETYLKNFTELTESLNLTKILNQPVRLLSLGERVKSEIACSLLHNPKVLFLDEPTIGLDIESKFELRKYLAHRSKENNMSILLTSHDMGDVENLCDQLALLKYNTIQINDHPDNIKNKYGTNESLENVIMKIFKNEEVENASSAHHNKE